MQECRGFASVADASERKRTSAAWIAKMARVDSTERSSLKLECNTVHAHSRGGHHNQGANEWTQGCPPAIGLRYALLKPPIAVRD